MFYYGHDYITKERLLCVIALDAVFEKWLVSFDWQLPETKRTYMTIIHLLLVVKFRVNMNFNWNFY